MAQQENRSAFEGSLLAELRAAIRTQLEVAYIDGTGSSSQPLGLLRTSGTGSKTYGAAIPTYGELCDQIEILADANGDLAQARFLMHPSTLVALLKALVDSSGGGPAPIGRQRPPIQGPSIASTPTRDLPSVPDPRHGHQSHHFDARDLG